MHQHNNYYTCTLYMYVINFISLMLFKDWVISSCFYSFLYSCLKANDLFTCKLLRLFFVHRFGVKKSSTLVCFLDRLTSKPLFAFNPGKNCTTLLFFFMDRLKLEILVCVFVGLNVQNIFQRVESAYCMKCFRKFDFRCSVLFFTLFWVCVWQRISGKCNSVLRYRTKTR